jgi:hypothetical protein
MMVNTRFEELKMNCSRIFLYGALMMIFTSSFGMAAESNPEKANDIASLKPAGETYQAVVPDTLDLADRAKLAINGLTGAVDPQHGYTQYFMTRFAQPEPYLIHMDYGDIICTAKWLESLPMMRIMSGSDQNLDVEQKMMADLVDRMGDDGLIYITAKEAKETPWLGKRGSYPLPDEDLSSLIHDGRAMLAMMAWYERDHDKAWLKRLEKMAAGIQKAAIVKGDYAYYPEGKIGMEFSWLRESGYKDTKEPGGESEGAEGSVLCYQGSQIRALSRWYMMSGDRKSLELAGKLVNFVTQQKFWNANDEGTNIVGAEHGHFRHPHLHARMISVRGILEYAEAADDIRLKEFVRDTYEFIRGWGIGRMGLFAQQVGNVSYVVEGCTIADMVALAIRLSDYGVGDYWDDVDQIVRNQLVEQQLINADLLEKVSRAVKDGDEKTSEMEPKLASWNQEFYGDLLKRSKPDPDDAIQRSVGLFAGAGLPTCLAYPVQLGCCSGNATNALYYAWESIVRFNNGTAQVNLLLNRASPWLDIDSWLPYEGKIVLHNKQADHISVRIPGWVEHSKLTVKINDRDFSPRWAGNFLFFDQLDHKDVITIEFPMVEQTITYTLPRERKYTLNFKGNTVVDISPREELAAAYPIYLRDDYKKDSAPMTKKTRYVADEVINW